MQTISTGTIQAERLQVVNNDSYSIILAGLAGASIPLVFLVVVLVSSIARFVSCSGRRGSRMIKVGDTVGADLATRAGAAVAEGFCIYGDE